MKAESSARSEPESEFNSWGLHRPPVGARPGTFAIHADALPSRLQMTRFDADTVEAQQIDIATAVASIRAAMELEPSPEQGVLWIDVQGLGDEGVLRALGEELGLHPLSLEDIVHTHQRPKVDVHADHLLIFVRMVCPGAVKRTTEQLALVVRKHVVVTFQETWGDCFDPVRARIQQAQGRARQSGSDYLAYALLDAVIDAYFPLVESVGDKLAELEEDALVRPSRSTVRSINERRAELAKLRRAVWPQREALATILRVESHLVDDAVMTFFRDVHDHTVQLAELLEVQRDAAGSLMNTYLSSVANRQNEVMKVLTVITSVFIPLSFLTGLYGMNFKYMPELDLRWGYPVVLGVMLLLGFSMLYVFYRSGWLGRRPRP